ncbi:MAG: GH92 family glycosyl hydrolase [Bacteroidota bacterium]
MPAKALLFIVGVCICSCAVEQETQPYDPVSYVDPFIGTAGGGNTYPGAVRPWGMVSVSPHNNLDSKSGYFYDEPHIYGFGHTHLSGTGCQDFGNVVLMPTSQNASLDREAFKSEYGDEVATAGYYSVNLTGPLVGVEMTATTRVGISRYAFNQGKGRIILDGGSNLSSVAKFALIKKVSNTELEGWSDSGAFCGRFNEQRVYFVLRVSTSPVNTHLWENLETTSAVEVQGDGVGAVMDFDTSVEEVIVKVGISYVSIENARLNLEAEASHWDFDAYWDDAATAWNQELSRIQVSGSSEQDKTKFYTALYHMLLQPGVFSDVNGQYKTMENQQGGIGTSDFTRYHVFSLWDTYRTVHPLLALVYPGKQRDMVQSMIGMYEENGWLPKWELAGEETLVMVGDPASIVISDTYMKGIQDFDVTTAWEVVWKQAFFQPPLNPIRPGIEVYDSMGYIPYDYKAITTDRKEEGFVWGTVSTSLEYNHADWSIAQFADSIGKDEEADYLKQRSRGYTLLYDEESMFLRPRNRDGSWMAPFDPIDRSSELGWQGSGGKGYVEGSAWQYNFFVPHDPFGLMDLMGGETAFLDRLQTVFDDGHFSLHNEPDMGFPYLFNYVRGEEWRTQELTTHFVNDEYGTGPDGIPGNDDTGTMSGWLVWSAMGLYHDKPGGYHYQLSSPIFDEVRIQLDPTYHSGKEFVINVERESASSVYIHDISWNGNPFKQYYFDHNELVKGGTLRLSLKDQPKK